VTDLRCKPSTVEFLVEEELEGEYTKWWVLGREKVTRVVTNINGCDDMGGG
jgi:hypothetical protein